MNRGQLFFKCEKGKISPNLWLRPHLGLGAEPAIFYLMAIVRSYRFIYPNVFSDALSIPEWWPEASPGFLFGGVGMLWPGKGYHATPAGGPGCEGPRTLAKFNFLKRCKELENESIFQKYPHFYLPKNPFFPRKLSKIHGVAWNFSRGTLCENF